MGWQKRDRRHCSQIALGAAPRRQTGASILLPLLSLASPHPSIHTPHPQPKFRKFCSTEQPCRIQSLFFSFYFSSASVVLHTSGCGPSLSFCLSFFSKISNWKSQSVISSPQVLFPIQNPKYLSTLSVFCLHFPTVQPTLMWVPQMLAHLVQSCLLSIKSNMRTLRYTFISPPQMRHGDLEVITVCFRVPSSSLSCLAIHPIPGWASRAGVGKLFLERTGE